MNKKQIDAIKKVVEDFEVDGTTDYARMDAAILKATGVRLDNQSLWGLINRAKGAGVERISFSLD